MDSCLQVGLCVTGNVNFIFRCPEFVLVMTLLLIIEADILMLSVAFLVPAVFITSVLYLDFSSLSGK